MLHQTLVSFQPFSSSSSSPYPLPSPSASAGSSSSTFLLSAGRLLSSPPPYPRSSQVNMKLMKETLSSARDQGFLGDEVDDVAWAAERGNLLGEDFQVDDLLDLRGLPEYDEDEEAPRAPEATFSPPKSLPCAENEPLELYSEITLHETDAASLEWLSRFFDDCSKECTSPPPSPSYFDMPLSLPTQNNPPWKYSSAGSRGEPTPSLSSTATAAGSLSTEGLVPIKAKRSKRLRGSGTVWSRSGSLRLADSSSPASSITTFTAASASASSSPSPSSSSSSSSFNSYISYEAPPFAGFLLDDSSLAPPKAQRPKKRGRKPKNPFISPAERRCTHCGVHKTPQWRAGPHGAKTLCNACGVRFKSGRLLPEYRPACSPTFVSNIHSNSHRKVLEMRRKKDEQVLVTSAPPVTSC